MVVTIEDKKRYDRQMRIHNEIESSHAGAICPHCYALNDSVHDCFTGTSYDDETVETECDHCEKPFSVTISIEVTFASKLAEESDEDD